VKNSLEGDDGWLAAEYEDKARYKVAVKEKWSSAKTESRFALKIFT
jgi:hypothetical protein